MLGHRSKLDVAVQSAVDNILFSKKEAWAYYRLSTTVYDFLASQQKIETGLRITSAFANIMSNKQDSVDGHLIVTNVPLDVDAWEAQILGVMEDHPEGPGFKRFMAQQNAFLRKREYSRRVCYVGINLGGRNTLDFTNLNVLESGFKNATETIKQWIDKMWRQKDGTVDKTEEDMYRRREEDMYAILSNGALQAQRATTEEILLAIKRMFYPHMPAPYLEIDHSNRLSQGDMDIEMLGQITPKARFLKFTQPYENIELESYRACLTFTRFPKTFTFPYDNFPFLYLPATMNVPFTAFSRFTLYPNAKMKSDVERKSKEMRDEVDNIMATRDASDGMMSGLPAGVAETIEDLEQIKAMLEEDKVPWLRASYHLVLEGPTEKFVQDVYAALRQEYQDRDTVITWTSGDQMDLFLEQMPGDTKRIKSFEFITNLALLTTSGFNFASEIGDRIYGL